jgi:hypothetical protein
MSATKKLWKFNFPLILLLVCCSTIIILHDCHCHDSWGGLCTPLHHLSNISAGGNEINFNPEFGLFLRFITNQIVLPEFVKNIFHPPN